MISSTNNERIFGWVIMNWVEISLKIVCNMINLVKFIFIIS
jgi:hypothetical protein